MPTLRIHNDNKNIMHYLTITTIEWIDIFTKAEYFKIITDSMTFCRKNKGLLLYDFVIMTNHIHLIVKAREDNDLSDIIRDFKNYTTTKIISQLEQDNRKYILNLIHNSFKRKKANKIQVWQRENYPIPIASEKFYLEKANYLFKNPVRKGYVKNEEDWLYSSACCRLKNQPCLIELDNPVA
jgi:putative transposase